MCSALEWEKGTCEGVKTMAHHSCFECHDVTVHRYFDVEEKFVPLTEDCFVMTPEKMVEAIDENTIGELIPSANLILCRAVFHTCLPVSCS